jgi:hypothetical protein
MKRNYAVGMLLPLLVTFGLAQEAVQSPVPVSPVILGVLMSVETGHYDPEPSCRKEIDGCFAKVWTAAKEFKAGERVWLRVSITNRSDYALIEETRPEFPVVHIVVTDNATRSTAALTRKGCQLRPDCVPRKGDPGTGDITLSGLGGAWIIPPGKSESTIVEITHEFSLTNPGTYP